MKRILASIICALPLLAVFSEVPITADGIPVAQIVLSPGSGESGKLAAEEIQYWGREITGAKLSIAADADTEKSRIILKCDPSLKLKADGFVISEPVKGREILIAAPKPRGILSGAWKLLFINTDIIWARPSPAFGTVFTPRKTLSFSRTSYRYDPVFILRGFQFGYYAPNEMWQARNGNNYSVNMVRKGKFLHALYDDGFTFVGWHNLVRFYFPEKKYWKDHPEFYALINGKRQQPSTRDHLGNLCFSNPECREEFLKNFRKTVEDHPEYDLFGVVEEDNLDSCMCPDCVKPIPLPNGTMLTIKDKNFRSTQFFQWLTPAAEMLQKDFPGKKIKTNAYFLTEPAPGCPVSKNVEVHFCPIYKDSRYPIDHPVNRSSLEKFLSWIATGASLFWREYYGLTGEFPRPVDVTMSADLKFVFSKYGINRTRSEMIADLKYGKTDGDLIWDQNSLYFYVLAHLHEDPFRPVEEIRKEFLDRVYGDAASYVGEYYSLLEKAWRKIPVKSLWDDQAQAKWNRCFDDDPDLKKKLASLLDKAKQCKMQKNGRIMLDRLIASFEKRSNFKPLIIPVMKAAEKVDFSDPLFEKGAWKNVPSRSDFLEDKITPAIKPHTMLKFLHDEKNLYIACRCSDPNGLNVFAAKPGSQRDVWPQGNKIECLFSNAYGRRIQLVLDCNGNIMDVLVYNKKWDKFFDLPIKKDSEGWSALITVPLSLMGGDKGKKELPFYFIRYFSDPAAKKKATLRFAVDVPVEEPLVYPRLKLMLPEKK